MQRRKLVIGGCIFAAVVLGVACTGITPAQAASCEVAISATGDQMLSSSSDWTWAASDGDLSKTPPLGIGQEVLQGGYSDRSWWPVPGPIESNRGRCRRMKYSSSRQVSRWTARGPGSSRSR